MTLLFFTLVKKQDFFLYFFFFVISLLTFSLIYFFTLLNPALIFNKESGHRRCYRVSDVHICTHNTYMFLSGHIFFSNIHSFIFMKEKKKNFSNPKVLSHEDRNLKKNSQIEISLQCCKHNNVFTCLRKKMVLKINKHSLPYSHYRGELMENMDLQV